MKTLKEQAIDTVIVELQETNTNLLDNPFRLGSLMYFEVIKEAKKLVEVLTAQKSYEDDESLLKDCLAKL